MYDTDLARLKKIRDEFIARGESVADWARQHQFRTSIVYAILSGRQKCLRGEGHHVAVALGLKSEPKLSSDDKNNTHDP